VNEELEADLGRNWLMWAVLAAGVVLLLITFGSWAVDRIGMPDGWTLKHLEPQAPVRSHAEPMKLGQLHLAPCSPDWSLAMSVPYGPKQEELPMFCREGLWKFAGES
jgi:hypothetical protein